jgi:hypothetical protein
MGNKGRKSGKTGEGRKEGERKGETVEYVEKEKRGRRWEL